MDKNILHNKRITLNERKKEALNRVDEYNKSGTKEIADFYKYIATLSGGAIALSISFLGYLKESINTVDLYFFINFNNFHILIFAWIFLIIAFFVSLYKGLIISEARYYNVIANYIEYLKDNDENIVLMNQENMIYNKLNPEDIAEKQKNIGIYDKAYKINKKRFNFSNNAQIYMDAIADITFISGISFLVIFGIISLLY